MWAQEERTMKRLIAASLLACLGLMAPAQAATPGAADAASAPAKTAQQGKMAQCNDQAAGKSGDERQAFMKQCLSAKKSAQTDKMRSCNAQAKGMKGEERKTFMKSCLSA
jgi:hypothetical protein